MNWEALFWKFLKFGVVGFSGTFIDFGVTYLIKEKLKGHKYLANSTGFVLAATSNYILNRIWTFQSHDSNVSIQFIKFFTVSIIGLAFSNAIIWLLHEKFKLNFYISKVLAIGVVMIWNFFGNLIFTFGE
ncbi:GtrA family protein [Flammeovirga kamogawensis]|uniref:GtrA family protein n=1 Tax=Flammeovirga kamogawensis TaxID=373891 RepID=A0ABX8GTV8_9BACT|nr:GtrA family protein [Flammeovirga kamogawensis]MBB6462461.1 putative flippase GtrA [Flammeovirga kamogawensis]QWG06801.1 GtrA family protein [Flammeovirga kamogawensis]TRX68624.1 GtrA family protein [Flammeovirga kamogawensis]